MGIFQRAFRASIENPSTPLSKATEMLLRAWGSDTYAGKSVSPTNSIRVNAVYSCVSILADVYASRPLKVYEHIGENRRPAVDHPVYRILHDEANVEITAFKFHQTMMAHSLLFGNAYAEIEYNNAGQVIGLWPLVPNRVEPKRVGAEKKLIYLIRTDDGERIPLAPSQVIHIQDLGISTLHGESRISLGSNSIGVAMAAEEFAARFYGQGTVLGGAVQTDQELSDEAFKRLEVQLEQKYKGLSNAHRIAILEQGLKWTQMGISPEQAQFIESRKFQVNEICRLFRVPPHLVSDVDGSTSWGTGIGEQTLNMDIYVLDPWFIRTHQEYNRKLFASASERRRYFCEHVLDAKYRGDIKTRYEAYAIARQWGWYSANDVRKKENENSIGPAGDIYLVPVNMVSAEQMISETEDPVLQRELRQIRSEVIQKRSIQTRLRLRKSYSPVIEDAARRMIRIEVNDLKRIIEKHLRDLQDAGKAIEDFYRDFPAKAEKIAGPAFFAYATATVEMLELGLAEGVLDRFAADYTRNMVLRHVIRSKKKILQVLNSAVGSVAENLLGILNEWDENRVGQVTRHEVVQAGEAFARHAYEKAGFDKFEWRTLGENCPLCDQLDGKVTSGHFLNQDDTVDPDDGETAPLRVNTSISHAPLHEGCDCMVVPA